MSEELSESIDSTEDPSDVRQSDRPHEDLGFCIIEQAIIDLKALHKFKVIVDGKPIRDWPSHTSKSGVVRPAKYLGYYNSTASVEELLHFFRSGGMQSIINALHSDFNCDRAVKALFENKEKKENQNERASKVSTMRVRAKEGKSENLRRCSLCGLRDSYSE
jgi:hypothetical protein